MLNRRRRDLWQTGLAVCLASCCAADLLAADTPAATSGTQTSDSAPSRRPWGVLFYHGLMTDNSIWQVIGGRNVIFKYGSLNSMDLAYELQHENPFRRFWQPLVGTIQVAGDLTQGSDARGKYLEVAPYVMWRWRHLPFEKYVVSTIGVGEGISYATAVPMREGRGKHVLDFIAVEATVGLPSYPNLQVVARIHHRSPAWGLFGQSISSNALGMGIRYLF